MTARFAMDSRARDWASNVILHPQFAERESDYLRWYPKTLTAVTAASYPSWANSSSDGAYIHVPFCDQICKFCPFHKGVTHEREVESYLEGLLLEIDIYAASLRPQNLQFVYFGGGTPSVLAPRQFARIVDRLQTRFGIATGAEISVEMHPTHAKREHIQALVAAGANRFSLGIQSFEDRHLQQLGAVHTADDGKRALEALAGFPVRTAIDLVYRYPGQGASDWDRELRTAIESFIIPHLSCYSLVEVGKPKPGTPSAEVDVELAAAALVYAESRGMQHYASCASGGFDVCLPGHQGQYEQRHWQAPQASFMALGPGAIGYVGEHATVNFLNLEKYLRRVRGGRLPLISATTATPDEQRRRYFTLGVKAIEVPYAPYRERFGSDPRVDFHDEIKALVDSRLATSTEHALTLTKIGRLFVDSCSAAFYSDAERHVPHPEEPEFRRLERRPELALA